MDSFSSELGVKFSIQLEANHVIRNSQVNPLLSSNAARGTKTKEKYDKPILSVKRKVQTVAWLNELKKDIFK